MSIMLRFTCAFLAALLAKRLLMSILSPDVGRHHAATPLQDHLNDSAAAFFDQLTVNVQPGLG